MRFYVGNIPYRTTTEELQKLFDPFGTVTSVNIVTDKDTGQSKGFAFVDIDADLDTIISQLNGTLLHGRSIKVSQAIERHPNNDRGRSDSGRGRLTRRDFE
ncbi:MAG: RNA-binding protein [Acidobacteriota bacterium]